MKGSTSRLAPPNHSSLEFQRRSQQADLHAPNHSSLEFQRRSQQADFHPQTTVHWNYNEGLNKQTCTPKPQLIGITMKVSTSKRSHTPQLVGIPTKVSTNKLSPSNNTSLELQQMSQQANFHPQTIAHWNYNEGLNKQTFTLKPQLVGITTKGSTSKLSPQNHSLLELQRRAQQANFHPQTTARWNYNEGLNKQTFTPKP